jgi:leucyl aminopeptidase
MDIQVKKTYIKKDNKNIKVFLLFEENYLEENLKKYDIKCPKSVYEDFNGKKKEIIQFYNGNEIVVLLGLGEKAKINIDKLGKIINHLGFLINHIDKERIIYYLALGELEFLKDQMFLLLATHYDQKNFLKKSLDQKNNLTNKKTNKKSLDQKNNLTNKKTNKKSLDQKNNLTNKKTNKKSLLKPGIFDLNFFLKSLKSLKSLVFVSENHIKKLNECIILSGSVNLVKDLGNLPGNILTPPKFVKIITNLGKLSGFNVTVLGHKKLRKMGMNTLLSVSQGSRYSGYLVKIQPKKCLTISKKEKPIVLVGKGITFDSGGTSIKRPRDMIDMKTDMLGAATILGAINHLSKMGSNKNVIGLLAIAENMPGKFASRPGDIVKSYSGKTVEIVDTDAEGRLVMADAIAYAHTFKPKLIMDIAGLTGAQANLSEGLFASIMGNNRNKNSELIKMGEKVNERLVELPIYPENVEQTKSEIADFKNYNYKYKNGIIYAGAFLSNFVEEGQDWIHMDIAGPEKIKDTSTGFGVRLLVDYL